MLLLPFTAFSQINCETCKEKEYPFIGCIDGHKDILCLSDPNNEEGFLPWKKCLNNIIMIYDSTNFPLQQNGLKYAIELPRNDGFGYQKVFSRYQIIPNINQALNDWLQPSCYPNVNNDKCQPCKLKVKWVRDASQMSIYPDVPSITYQPEKKPNAGGACDQDCDFSEIRLNGTPEWTGINPNDVSGSIAGERYKFFRTDHDSLQVATTNKCYDMRSILRHEIGHWLGFGDMLGTRYQSCSNSNSVMYGDNFNYDKNVDVSLDDRCMFTVLYCCATNPSSVEETQTINSDFNIFPNPTSSYITISMSPSTEQYVKKLRVVDIGGKTVFDKTYPAGNTDCIVQINGLSKGAYLFVMTFEGINGSFAEKVIVE